MNQIFRQLRLLALAFLLCGPSVFAQSTMPDPGRFQPYGEGLPIPWPFPWAKECPVDWQSMDGRYLLSDSSAGDQIDLKITIISKMGRKLVRVTRYSTDGKMISDGFTWVAEAERTVRLWMYASNPNEAPTWAILKLYYGTAALRCAEDQLVPILTLDQPSDPNSTQKQYRLMRLRLDND